MGKRKLNGTISFGHIIIRTHHLVCSKCGNIRRTTDLVFPSYYTCQNCKNKTVKRFDNYERYIDYLWKHTTKDYKWSEKILSKKNRNDSIIKKHITNKI